MFRLENATLLETAIRVGFLVPSEIENNRPVHIVHVFSVLL